MQPTPGQFGFGQPPRLNQLIDLARGLADVQDLVGSALAVPPVVMGTVSGQANGLTFPADNAWHNYNIQTITVPPGCTHLCAVVAGTAQAYAQGSTLAIGSQVTMTTLGGTSGGTAAFTSAPAANTNTSSMSIMAFALGGWTPGSTFTFQNSVNNTGPGTTLPTSTWCNLSGALLWFR